MAKIKYKYVASGYVLGKLWGGGSGYYPARKYEGSSLSKIKTKIRKDFKSGGLDSGMGFESLTGALMNIQVISSRQIGKTIYKNNDRVIKFKLGKIDESNLFDSLGY